MLLGALASCTTTPEETTGGTGAETTEATTDKSTAPTESTNKPDDSEVTDESEPIADSDSDGADSSEDSEADSNSATVSDTNDITSPVEDTEDTDVRVEVPAPSIGEHAYSEIITNANALMNGVNARFGSGMRNSFVLENQNMTLSYALSAGAAQQISSIVNKSGNAYVQNTADVFVTMTGGQTYYASSSTKPATANLYRFGYYMYEARFEEQNFRGAYDTSKTKTLSISSVSSNETKVTKNEDGSLHVIVTKNYDPFISLKNVSYSASDYPYLAITLKANIKSARGITVYLSTDSHSMGSGQGVTILASDEYETYYVPLYLTSWYTGTVTGIRFDFADNSSIGEYYDIKEVKVVGGSTASIPEDLGINRSFFVYSDKLHQVIQFASANVPTENIASVGMETKIAKDTVDKVVVKDKDGVKYSFDGIDWASAEFVGFDIKDAGIFGYILPAGEKTDRLEVIERGDDYVIIQSRTPENGTIKNSAVWDSESGRYVHVEGVTENGNDLFMGQRLYTDESHDFTKFLLEAYIERNPLGESNFVINKRDSSYECTYECPECGATFAESLPQCPTCYEKITPIAHPNMYFIGYDALRGLYDFRVPSEGFSPPYFQYPNKYIDLTFTVRGDDYERSIYFMTSSTSGCLECAAVLDEDRLMLPIPVEVGKNFSEGGGERNLWNVDDDLYGEAIIPLIVKPDSKTTYTMLNLYQNWGQYPLKQVSWIQFYAPYYHLSTGVTETNCIVPYYSCKNVRGLGTLPDHRAMSAHLWSGQPQHTSGGSHRWLIYTDADGNYSASENTLDYIDSYGPIYADVYMDYLSDDGKIKVSYTHTEFPQTDENRAYYEMKYEILEDISFENFAEDFCFYDVDDNDSKGSYKKVGYLNADNQPTIVDSTAVTGKTAKYVLGTEFPYFSFFDMPDYNVDSTSAEGFTNLSFIVYSSEIIINGEKSDARFVIINEGNRVRISLDLGEVTLKAGDSFVINAIITPWGDETLNYDEVGDKNVRDIRTNTCLNPLTVTAGSHAEIIESVFLPKVKTTNGKDATFTLKDGQNNVAVRVYGFTGLTAPKIQEKVGDEWVDYRISSAYKPDRFGNAFYYDGYSVHYDADGTFSYSFIVPMDYTDADGRTFRVIACEAFDGWPSKLPVIDKEEVELPMNVFSDATQIFTDAKSQAGKMFGTIAMSQDGTYVTLSSNEKAQEAYFNIWAGDGGKTVTGQYFVLKYRLPETNNKQHRYFEIFTNTVNAETSKSCFGISNALISDGQWHTLVIDFASFESSVFTVNEDGNYCVRFVRIDLFNEYYANGNSIDIEFFGISDSIEEIRGYERVDSINLYTKGGAITSYDKEGNEIETPSSNNASTSVEGFTFYVDTSNIADAATSDSGHIGSTVLAGDKSYVSLHYARQYARLESYITVFAGNRKATGQYLIFKYRTDKQAGTIEFYCGTEADGAKSGLNFNLNHNKNYLFIADGQWHTVVVDLTGVLPADAFKANSAGEYIAKFIRLDLFNFDSAKTEDFSVDVAYIGFSDNYEDAISHDENTWFYDGKQSINVSTGEPLTPPEGGKVEDATSSVPGFNVYIDSSSLASIGKNTAWKDSVILNSAEGYTTFKNDVNATNDARKNESYFTFFNDNVDKATGQYVVIKYRSNVQQGYITVWSSTQNASAASGSNYDLNGPASSNKLFIADNEWHIVVLDLSKLIPTFTAKDGKFVATHLRLDFFNFGSPRDPADTIAQVDVAYIGICDDYTEIITHDKSVSELVFFDGNTTKYSTATGEITEAPEVTPEPEPKPENQTFVNYFDAESILSASQVGGGHLGGGELIESDSAARLYNCVDSSKSNAVRSESYFYLLSNNTAETGRYLVLKYRAKHQVGYMQVYSSTVNASASDGGNSVSITLEKGLFVADNEWKIIILDLEKVLANYKPDANGKYYAKHLRIDLFNFGSPRTDSETAYVDIAYLGLSNDLSAVVSNDKSVDVAYFYDGSLKEYLTASGAAVDSPNFIINSAGLMVQTETTGTNRVLNSADNCVTYSHKANSGDNYVYMIFPNASVNVPTDITGQYIMIKYRTNSTDSWRFHIGANNGSMTAIGGKDSFSVAVKNGENGGIIADGEWQYLIIDTATFLREWGGVLPENGTEDVYSIDYMRIGFFSGNTDKTVEIQYVAFAETLEQLETYGDMDSYTLVNAYNGGSKNETVTVKQ